MVRVWGATAPACLLFLLLVALCARGAQAAPWQPPGAGDDDAGSPYPASQLDPRLEPQEDPRGSTGQVPPWNPAPEPASMGPTGAVLAGTGYSTPQPDVDHEPQVNLPDGTEGEGDPGSQMGSRTEALGDGLEVSPGRALPDPRLLPALEPSWYPRGPLTAKENAELRKSSPTSSDIVEDIIKELEEAAPGMVRETVPKEVLWQGSGRTLPLPGKRTEATQATPGPLRAKDKAERIKPSLLSSHIIEKIRKDLEKAAPGMVRETVPKKVLWQGSGRTLLLPGKRTEATQATATPDGTEGEGDPGSQMGSRTEALGDGLGPLTAKENAELRKSSPTSSDIVEDIIKELEEAAPGMVRETVPKEVLWQGSGRTLPLPGKRTEATQATPGPLTAKENAELRKSSPTSSDIVEDIIKELEEAAPGMVRETVPKEVLWQGSGRTLPLPGKRTEATQATPGPLTAKENAELRKSSPTSSDIVEDIIKELEEAAPGMVRETVPKEVLWQGSGCTLPLPGKRTEATQATPGPLTAKENAELRKSSPTSSDIVEDIIKELEEAAPGMVRETVPKKVLWQGSGRTLLLPGKRTEATQATARPGVDGENNANTAKPQNFQSYCIEGAAAFLVPLLLVTVTCCVLIRRWRQKNQCLAAAQAAQTDTRSRSVSPYRRPDHRGMPESRARRQRPPSVPGRPARLPPARPPRPPRPAPDQWKARDRPSTPQSSWTQTSPPRPPPPSSKGWGRPPQGAAQATVSINIE
ncbi:flocculation protein FLO11-like isoform X7 [Cygnus olor]|uniref:flocculation protein FLO11-like isoform X7 n=1 Tax=Cygnus olor TaxID=8869 RepID=UPI001ADE29BE|nr:flocculation protein FLO11-like isoform X7 [Cygnus olor]